ncbi:MAG: hypothetical protein UT30_C0004G0033 [Candidatus Uhrbacteria bacterium GW2011_GWF2_39_13]|uniref:Gfo/Idh/MocA-like oxidoreductase N-terminal domain-containing protein n=1 Tax=Candidatus Uhrbacteria bacterium GW2011_GWF2_39_13 TaxID=1618995 RepID=A0A0G0Q2S9_9BACT|nr:MAG: hypothetical protein UT30_C0004G0033 [Candidatus Uhrbacteria bacterium GW2011_GWF2_39_13]
MKKLRAGIIGCGFMAQEAHIPALSSLPNVEIAAICDPRKSVTERLSKKWSIPFVTDSVEKLLSSEIDFACIFTQVQLHKHHIDMAIDAGKHVFTEKPLAMSAESAKSILAKARKAGTHVAVGYMKRHEKNIRAALELNREKNTGNIIFARSHSFIGRHWDACVSGVFPIFSSDEKVPYDFSVLDPAPVWLKDKRDEKFYSFDNPYYALLDTGCHSVNLMRFVTGKTPEISSVIKSNGLRIVNMDFGNFRGVIEFCVNFNMNKWDEVTELYSEKSTLKIFTPPPTFMQSSAKAELYTENGLIHTNTVFDENHQWAFKAQMEDFIDTITKGNINTMDLEDSIEDISLIEQIYRRENNI